MNSPPTEEKSDGDRKAGETPTLLERFTALLGEDVFFVPCEWGTKRPLLTYVERPFEATKTEAYRAVFDAGDTNIAVYLGKASGGCVRLILIGRRISQLFWR